MYSVHYYECHYCGHTWKQNQFSAMADPDVRCPQCNDSNIKNARLNPTDVFGYNWEKKQLEKAEALRGKKKG